MAAAVVCAVYGAADLSQATTVFLDSAFGMGYNLRELAQVGVDIIPGDQSHCVEHQAMHWQQVRVHMDLAPCLNWQQS